jgi:FkbM family methyltransferase
MATVLLDLGTHFGQGLRDFIARFRVDNSWIVHTFEANPTSYNLFKGHFHQLTPYVIHHNKAICDYDGTITVNIETPPGEGETGMGSTVIAMDERSATGGSPAEFYKTTAEVPCIDLSTFIQNNFTPDDVIVIKMDIEGAEYSVLEKMIKDGTLKWVNFIAVEWHSRCFADVPATLEREHAIKKYCAENQIQLESWQ